MKETIYTIPINEAFDTDCECPICHFLKKEEYNRVEYSLGASMMEPDSRILSNERGYCSRHTQMMYNYGNKLSHALVLETRLQYIENTVKNLRMSISKKKDKSFFGRRKTPKLHTNDNFKLISETSHSCAICERLDKVIAGFVSNLFHMYKNDADFRDKFFSSKGFCLKHFELLLTKSSDYLSNDSYIEFVDKICLLQEKQVARVKDDVNWFTKKFDYRYKDEDWKNSKDAVQRGCLKISGFIDE